jgi:uncharacterized protein YndB with AHSA1/START domain
MTTPDVPHRLEMSFELPGTPEQVWEAIATAKGMSAWFLRTDVDEREGGTLVIHMGDTDSEGTITGWDPPRRLVYEEDWASLTGHPDAALTPLVSEFVVEARSGGTCVLRVVTSAFGTGADWEHEFFDEMGKSWKPFFDNLRMYLEDFAGQRATPLEVSATTAGRASDVVAAMRRSLGAGPVGSTVTTPQVEGVVRREDDSMLVIRTTSPAPGYIGFWAHDTGDDTATAVVQGWLFSPDAPDYVQREQEAWVDWLNGLAVASPK